MVFPSYTHTEQTVVVFTTVCLFVKGKPLVRRVVQEKASADDEERKTPFAIMRVRSGNCTEKQREVIQE